MNDLSMISVMLVIPAFGVGGTEKQVLLLARGLSQSRRFRPIVCSLNGDGPLGEKLREAGVATEIIKKRRRIDPMLVWDVFGVVRRQRASVVHTFLPEANTWARAAGLLAEAPVVIASERSTDYYKTTILKAIDNRLATAGFAVVANSELVRQDLISKCGVKGDSVRVVHNGIDPVGYCPADAAGRHKIRADLGLPQAEVLLGTVSRLNPIKNLTGLISTFNAVFGAKSGVRLVIVGGAQTDTERRYENMLFDLVVDLKLTDRVTFVGEQSNVAEYMSALDIYIQASHVEGFPNSVMEAMATGLPTVATAAGGTSELVSEGQTGFLVPCGDAQALGAAMLRMVSERNSWEKMGRAGRDRVANHFSIEAMVRRTEAIYEQGLDDYVHRSGSARFEVVE